MDGADSETNKYLWRWLLLGLIVIMMVVSGFRYGWGITIIGGIVLLGIFNKVHDLFTAYLVGSLKVGLETDRLAMGDTLRGVVFVTAKKPLKCCKIRVDLKLVKWVWASSGGRGSESSSWGRERRFIASGDPFVIDSGRDMVPGETWEIPFELVAAIHQSSEKAKTGFWSKLGSPNGGETGRVEIPKWQNDRSLRWEVTVKLSATAWDGASKEKYLKFVKGGA